MITLWPLITTWLPHDPIITVWLLHDYLGWGNQLCQWSHEGCVQLHLLIQIIQQDQAVITYRSITSAIREHLQHIEAYSCTFLITKLPLSTKLYKVFASKSQVLAGYIRPQGLVCLSYITSHVTWVTRKQRMTTIWAVFKEKHKYFVSLAICCLICDCHHSTLVALGHTRLVMSRTTLHLPPQTKHAMFLFYEVKKFLSCPCQASQVLLAHTNQYLVMKPTVMLCTDSLMQSIIKLFEHARISFRFLDISR